MKAKIVMGATAGVVALCAWMVMASRFFVAIAGLSIYFPSPWVTWWQYASQGHVDGSTVVYLVVSALITAVPLTLIGFLVVMILIRVGSKKEKLWGETGFAKIAEMDKGGIKTKEKIFQ